MKYLVLIAFLIPGLVFAQKEKRDVLNPNQLGVEEFKLEAQKTAPADIQLPFKGIRIIDSRYDTSKLGYIPTDGIAGKKRSYEKLVVKGGNAYGIERYYNEYYAGSFTPNGFELLIVMKRFWLSGDAKSNNNRVELANSVGAGNSIYCKWEYYLGKDGKYLPVKRIDSILVIDVNLAKHIDAEFAERREPNFKFALKALIELLDYSNAVKQFDLQPKKTLDEIHAFNKRMNQVPVLLDSGFKKGVYLSFDDFKNNRPSIVEFREKKMHYGKLNNHTEIYLEDMNGQTISNYWGFSDGTTFRYGMLGNDKIYRINNTFCFFIKVVGYRIDQGTEGQYGGSGITNTSKDKYEVWVPFQIDMETGIIY
jgi:hypothetical protein